MQPEPMVTSPRISASWQMMERLPTLMLLAFGGVAVEAVEDVPAWVVPALFDVDAGVAAVAISARVLPAKGRPDERFPSRRCFDQGLWPL